MDRKVVFIVGNSRSGTTLMAYILGNNKEIYSFNELHFFERFWTKDNSFFSRKRAYKVLHELLCCAREHPFVKCKKGLFDNDIEKLLNNKEFPVDGVEVYRDFLFYETEKMGKQIPCEQTPRNLFYLDTVFEYFPNAKIIYMVRDPRDTTLSQKFKWKRIFKTKNEPYPLWEAVRNFVNYHPFTMSLLWKSSANAILPYLNSENVMCVKFESLLDSPEKVVKNVCDFIGIKYHSSMLDVPYAFSSIYKDKMGKKGFDKKRSGNWKRFLSDTEVFIVEKVNKDLMEKFGYSLSTTNPKILGLVYYFVVFLPKMVFAVLFNLTRNKSLFSSIISRLRRVFR